MRVKLHNGVAGCYLLSNRLLHARSNSELQEILFFKLHAIYIITPCLFIIFQFLCEGESESFYMEK